MLIVLPTGDVVDTTGAWLEFVNDGSNTLKLNGTQVYKAGSAFEWYLWRQQVQTAVAAGSGKLVLAAAAAFTSGTVSPSTVAAAGGDLVTLAGAGFQTGCTGGIDSATSGTVSVASLAIAWQSLSPTQATFIMPATAAGNYTITVANPDGGLAQWTITTA